MKKIPLEPVITGAFRFLFTNIVSIVGVMWFPLLVFVALVAGLVCGIVPHAWLHGDFTALPDPQAYILSRLPLIVLALPVFILGSLLLGAMIRVGILRHALGEKTRTSFIYFSLGARVWRMAAAGLLYFAVYCGIEIVAWITIGIVTAVMIQIPQVSPVAAGAITAVLSLAAILAGIYILVRLFFFLPSVVVAENKVGVGRAWALGKGNVWRIVAVLIVVTLPVVLVSGVLFYVTVLSTILNEAARVHPAGPEQAAAFLKAFLPILPVIAAIFILACIAMTGLVSGAMGRAYKAVTAPEDAPKTA
jgi:hypothetical protein